MNVVDAVNRLRRAGDASGKSVQKLLDAAQKLAAEVAQAVRKAELVAERETFEPRLPRGYVVVCFLDGVLLGRPLGGDAAPADAAMRRFTPDWYDADITHDAARRLADDVAGGWLEELAAFLEKNGDADEARAEQLATAKVRP